MKRKTFIVILVCLFIVDFFLIAMFHGYQMQKMAEPRLEENARRVGIALDIVNFPMGIIFGHILDRDRGQLEILMPVLIFVALYAQAWVYFGCYVLASKAWLARRRRHSHDSDSWASVR